MGEVGTWVRLPWIWSRVIWNANGHSILRKVSQTDFPRKVQEEPHRHSWGSWEILWGGEEFWLSAPGGRLVLQLEVWVLYWDLGRPPKSYTKHHRISVSWEREKQYLYDTKQQKSFSCSKAELTVLCRVITEQTKQAPELREELSEESGRALCDWTALTASKAQDPGDNSRFSVEHTPCSVPSRAVRSFLQ